jgi:arginyl-tRNA synthetase
MLRTNIADLIRQAIQRAQQAGALPGFDLPAEIPITRPKPELGDYASPVAMALARPAGRASGDVALAIQAYLPPADYLGRVEVAGPGFLNLFLDDGWVARQVDVILDAGLNWGKIDLGRGKKVQVEHGSANPTGPLTFGTGRNVVIGDTLANVLAVAGYQVHREWYINDAGSQVRKFGESLFARYAQALGLDEPMPDDGYLGAYMTELGQNFAQQYGRQFLDVPRSDAVPALGEKGLQAMVEEARQTLARLNIFYDTWFSEHSLYESGLFDQVLKILADRGLTIEKDGAVWFAAQELGEDKDAVIIRSPAVIEEPNERPTYFASDIAYAWNKLVIRGFDRAIYVWGADHHGDVPRVKAVARALGLDADCVEIILYQLVTLKRGGEVVRMSKRTGEFITLDEVIDEVGSDAVRFMLLTRSADSAIDFDLELAKKQSEENPVFYVQYAHARIASIERRAVERGVSPEGGDVSLLTHPAELALVRQMLRLPEVIEQAATQLAPHHLTFYALDLATIFHPFYEQCRVVSSDPADAELSRARLKLVRATRQVLARTLGLLGVNAPERM